MYDWDVRVDRAVVDARYAAMLGYTAEDLILSRATWLAIIHPEDRAGAVEALQRKVSDRAATPESVYRMRTKTGEWRWIRDRGRVVEWDAAGQPLRIVGTHLDITEKRRTDVLLQEAVERLSLALQAANAGSWDWDLRTGEVRWSCELGLLLGTVPPSGCDLAHEYYIQMVHPEDRPMVLALRDQVTL